MAWTVSLGRITSRSLALAMLLGGATPLIAADPPAPVPVSATIPIPGTGQRRDETVLMVERVKGSVVNIHSERTVTSPSDDPFKAGLMQPQRVNGMGTGIVLDPRGYIVTNFHVVDDVQSLRVRLCDGTNCPARVLALDKESDLALIKIDPPKALPTVALGTSQDLMLAEKVFAIGNAYGYEHTVTVGHVSAMKRDVTLNKEISYRSLIQTQTPINPGNSGGPLFNKLGEVVGVNVAIRAGAQNIAFAIPVDTMITKAADMLSGSKRKAGAKHGLTLADKHDRTTEDGPVRRWVEVQKVDIDSSALAAGLKFGDKIEQVGEIAVLTSIDFERGLIESGSGKTKLKVRRDSALVDLELPAAVPEKLNVSSAEAVWSKMGMKLVPVGANLVASADKQLRGGLWISDVGLGSAAAKAGLQRGDILLGLHQWEALTVDNVTFVIQHKDLPTFNPVKCFFVRDGRIREATITIGE
jgi:serine protease Do